jgi:hypothetical protein
MPARVIPKKGGIAISKSSKIARRKRRREALKEEMLDLKNCNVNDPTPYEAMKRICNAEKQSIKNR